MILETLGDVRRGTSARGISGEMARRVYQLYGDRHVGSSL